jgi:prepilin signal peptidase PulO-like enzyme (type II secretory pathway)
MIFCFYLLVFVLGLCCGSFVNMLIYRVAINYELESRKFKVKSKNRSYCDYCGRQLKWYENIPVVSWLIQKGKTRCCGKKLPVLYPIVEIVMGILFLVYGFLGRPQESPLQFGLGLLVITFLVFSAVFDLRYMILPDFSTIILVTVAVIGILGRPQESPLQFVLTAIASFGFLYFLYLITKKKGMGFGDVKLAFFMGLFLGTNVIIAFYIAFIAGALVALILMIFKKANRKTVVPFGPFLILGTLVVWFWGSEIFKFLMSNF